MSTLMYLKLLFIDIETEWTLKSNVGQPCILNVVFGFWGEILHFFHVFSSERSTNPPITKKQTKTKQQKTTFKKLKGKKPKNKQLYLNF